MWSGDNKEFMTNTTASILTLIIIILFGLGLGLRNIQEYMWHIAEKAYCTQHKATTTHAVPQSNKKLWKAGEYLNVKIYNCQ